MKLVCSCHASMISVMLHDPIPDVIAIRREQLGKSLCLDFHCVGKNAVKIEKKRVVSCNHEISELHQTSDYTGYLKAETKKRWQVIFSGAGGGRTCLIKPERVFTGHQLLLNRTKGFPQHSVP